MSSQFVAAKNGSYFRINVDNFIKQVETAHSTTPLEGLDSLRLGHRYCEVRTSPLTPTIVPAGGVFATGRAHSYSGVTA